MFVCEERLVGACSYCPLFKESICCFEGGCVDSAEGQERADVLYSPKKKKEEK